MKLNIFERELFALKLILKVFFNVINKYWLRQLKNKSLKPWHDRKPGKTMHTLPAFIIMFFYPQLLSFFKKIFMFKKIQFEIVIACYKSLQNSRKPRNVLQLSNYVFKNQKKNIEITKVLTTSKVVNFSTFILNILKIKLRKLQKSFFKFYFQI